LSDRIWFAVPGDLETRTGGTIYDKKVIGSLRAAGRTVEHLAWPGSFPFPSDADLVIVEASLATCPDNALVVIDGLAFGVLSDIAKAEAERLRLVALVHHPLALESGTPPDIALHFAASERAALEAVRAVIVTSDITAATLIRDYGVPAGRITVAKPGIEKPNPPPFRDHTGTPHILSVGTVTVRKAHDILVDALSLLGERDWRCTIAGSLDRDPIVGDALKTQVARSAQAHRITLAGDVEDLSTLYSNADILVSTSRYEGYGMAIAEAMAYGLPVVAAAVGAVPDVVPERAGILLDADDIPAFAAAIRRLIDDIPYRAALSAGAVAAARGLNGWDDTAAAIASALDQVEAHGS
jgi:glycosyltransferase involved in cell wall biosynthesis